MKPVLSDVLFHSVENFTGFQTLHDIYSNINNLMNKFQMK